MTAEQLKMILQLIDLAWKSGSIRSREDAKKMEELMVTVEGKLLEASR